MKKLCSLLTVVFAVILPANCFAQKYVKSFPQYGFSIASPVPLSDISAQAGTNFLVNYAGYQDENNRKTAAFYQIMALRLPAGALDYSQAELERIFRNYMESTVVKSFLSKKAISFGYESYPGYEVTAVSNGYNQKGVFFLKGVYIIALTVITNYNMDSRFNSFTNGFKSLN